MIRKIAMLLSLPLVFASFTFAQEMPSPERGIERRVQIFMGDGGSYLGVQPAEVTKENFSKFGLKDVRGVAIEKVLENSPAAQAGLQNGDVITRINGDEISSTRKLMRVIGEIAPDHQARLSIVRGGGEKEISVTMGKRPTPKFEPGNFNMRVPLVEMPDDMDAPDMEEFRGPMRFPAPEGEEKVLVWHGTNQRQIGVGVSPLTKQLGEFFGVADGKGLLVNDVKENSAAAKAGIRAGDVIIEADGKAIAGMHDLIMAINEKKEGEIALTIMRNKDRKTIRVTPEKSSEKVPNDSKEIRIIERNENSSTPRAPKPPTPLVNAFGSPRVL